MRKQRFDDLTPANFACVLKTRGIQLLLYTIRFFLQLVQQASAHEQLHSYFSLTYNEISSVSTLDHVLSAKPYRMLVANGNLCRICPVCLNVTELKPCQHSAARRELPAARCELPAATGQQPGASSQQPAPRSQRPAVSNQQQAVELSFTSEGVV